MTVNIINDNVSGAIQTTNAQPIAALFYNLMQNSATKFTLSVQGRNSVTGDIFGLERKFMVKRLLSDVKVIGNIIDSMPLQSDPSLAGVSVNVLSNGASLEIDVVGIAGVSIDWDVQASLRSMFDI